MWCGHGGGKLEKVGSCLYRQGACMDDLCCVVVVEGRKGWMRRHDVRALYGTEQPRGVNEEDGYEASFPIRVQLEGRAKAL